MNTYVITLDKVPNREASKEIVSRHIAHLRKLDQEGSLEQFAIAVASELND